MEEALKYLDSLKPGEKIVYAQVAKLYGVDRSVLSRRHRGVCTSRDQQYENQRHLNNVQERELVQYIEALCKRGLPPTASMIRNFAAEISKKPVGKCWVPRFLERHKVKLLSRWTTALDRQRHKADSAYKYSLYFELLRTKIEQYNVEPRHIYNMDEKGFLIGMLSRMKRIFSREMYENGEIKEALQDGNREWISCLACICADGSHLPPHLIYQAASGNIQDTWLQDFDHQQHRTFFSSSLSGWTNNEIGLAWLRRVFDQETREKARRSYRLLILDGHGSHVTMEFIQHCDDNRILLAVLPPHATHTLQPLDVAMFKPLSTAYSNELTAFLDRCQGLSAITKRDFFRLFYEAWRTSFTASNVLSAFKCTGISPFDPHVILKRWEKKELSRPSTGDSKTSKLSTLSADDWIRIQRLLREVVADMCDERSKKLSQTIHVMSVQNSLLVHKNMKLEEALINERRRRQRGKPLLLEAPADYYGGAHVWSPTKVKDARDRQQQKDNEIAQKQLQKTEQQLLREQRKREKAEITAERARMRVQAKEMKEIMMKEKKAKAEEAKHLRQVQKQINDDIKSSKKASRRSTKLIQATEIDVDDVSVMVVPEGFMPTSPIQSRRGRNIKAPARYRM